MHPAHDDRLHDGHVDDRVPEGGEGVHVAVRGEARLQGVGEAGERPQKERAVEEGIADPLLDRGRVPGAGVAVVHKPGGYSRTSALSIRTGTRGLSAESVFTFPILSMTSSPAVTSPKTGWALGVRGSSQSR